MTQVAILTTKSSWFEPQAKKLVSLLNRRGYQAALFFDPKEISEGIEIAFILSYYKLIPKGELDKRKHNLVIHPSALPKGRGWAPLAWQILEGKDAISFTMFEAGEGVDDGPIYMEEVLHLSGTELHDEIREKQGEMLKEMVLKFLGSDGEIVGRPQEGDPTYYARRRPEDSELDLTKPLGEQINLLRITCNKTYPPFFYYKGKKFVLNIRIESEDLPANGVDLVSRKLIVEREP